MLLAIKYSPGNSQTQEDRRRARRLFVAWDPPTGVELQAHYHMVSGGGFIVVESESPVALFEALEPFKPMIKFDIEPVVNVIEALATAEDVHEWAETVLANGNGDGD